MRILSDPTANVAIGVVNREWKQMVSLAIRMQNDLDLYEKERHRFIGIYKHLLTDPMSKLLQYR